MEQSAIFGPFLAMMGLTLVVWILMFARRIRFLNSVDIEPDELTPARLAEISPPAVASPSDNLKNLFELPVLFYALTVYLYLTAQVDGPHLVAAWTFFVFRVAHSAVHCTINVVMLRFALYAVASVALWIMVARAAIDYLSA